MNKALTGIRNDQAVRNEWNRQYRERHKERINAGFRARRANDPQYAERLRQNWRNYRDRVRSINIVRHDPDTVYRMIAQAVSAALPRHMRDDVISSMLLAVLEGKLMLEQVSRRVREFVSEYNRQYDHYKHVSLDGMIPGTTVRRIDTLADDTFHF